MCRLRSLCSVKLFEQSRQVNRLLHCDEVSPSPWPASPLSLNATLGFCDVSDSEPSSRNESLDVSVLASLAPTLLLPLTLLVPRSLLTIGFLIPWPPLTNSSWASPGRPNCSDISYITIRFDVSLNFFNCFAFHKYDYTTGYRDSPFGGGGCCFYIIHIIERLREKQWDFLWTIQLKMGRVLIEDKKIGSKLEMLWLFTGERK